MEDVRNAYKLFFRKAEGKRLVGRPSCGWNNNIKMDLRDIGCVDMATVL
jgi:hypothetical protein